MRKSVKNLPEEYALFQELMDRIPDVVYFKDKSGKLIWVNRAHADGLGLEPKDVIGRTDFDFFPKKTAEKMVQDDALVFNTGKPVLDKVERATKGDNYVSTTKIPRFDEKGRVIGLMGITRDITRRIQFENLSKEKDQIEKKLKTLEELNQMKSEFVSVV